MLWTNVAFPSRHFSGLAHTYEIKTPAFEKSHLPIHETISQSQLETLILRLQKLLEGPRNRMALDLYLLELAELIFVKKKSTVQANENLPSWLAGALAQLTKPEHFRHGARGLSSLTGKSQAHVSRAVRKHFGKTPTDLVNEGRLRWAAGALETTKETISEIATACGYESLSYFYEVFQEKYHLTPQRYRETAKKIAGM